MPTKEEVAEMLAQEQCDIDADVQAVYRLLSDKEEDPETPVTLLIVSNEYERPAPTTVLPLNFKAHPESGLFYPYSLAVVLPSEFERIVSGDIALLPGYTLGRLVSGRVPSEQVAA